MRVTHFIRNSEESDCREWLSRFLLLHRVQGTVDHLRAAGLSNFKINRGDFSLIGIAVNIDLSWDEIALMTKYDLKGTLLDDMSFFGKGNIE